MKNNSIFRYILLLILLLGLIVITTEIIINKVKEDNYIKESISLQKQLKTLIDEKQSTTQIIAVSLSQNESIKDTIIKNKPELLDLNQISLAYRRDTNFKNVWMQIVTKDGISFSRSWVKKRGDSLHKARIDIPVMLKDPKIKSHISTGKFDLTFKSMVPIYKNDTFIGIFEVITHFNSISKILNKNGIESVFLVDKSYKKQLTKAFTKMFVNDYYIANFDAPQDIRDFLAKNNNVAKLTKKSIKYFIDEKNDRFITIYHLPDIKNKDMAYLFMSKELSLVKHDNITTLRIAQLSLVVLGFFVFLLIVLYNRVKSNEKELIDQNSKLEKQKIKTQKIFDSGPAITILTNGINIQDANKEFFNFFSKYTNVDEFKKDHNCICEFFEYTEEENYIHEKEVDGQTWINYLIKNNTKPHKVIMKKDEKEHHFVMIANISNMIEESSEKFIVVSFIDITEEIQLLNDIRQRDQILLQQSKMASMGEMLANIAHQWRQPLSVISTVSTGLKMKLEYNLFNSDDALKNLDTLNKNAQYLSNTIDDFRNFFNQKVEKNSFDLNNLIKQDINLLDVSLKNHEISVELSSSDKEIIISSFETKLTQVFLNIINNAKDALKTKEKNRIILINTSLKDDSIEVSIKDSAGGIEEDIINRVFEPYFTTKHQSQGTGIGLYMTEQIITKHLKGNIIVKNVEFEKDRKKLRGAEFIITLPLD